MRCPFCKKDRDKVIDSRSANAGATVRRRRGCLACEKRFTTYEKMEEITLYVIKKDGRRDVAAEIAAGTWPENPPGAPVSSGGGGSDGGGGCGATGMEVLFVLGFLAGARGRR